LRLHLNKLLFGGFLYQTSGGARSVNSFLSFIRTTGLAGAMRQNRRPASGAFIYGNFLKGEMRGAAALVRTGSTMTGKTHSLLNYPA
jgi:hypothetical protein